MSVPWGVRGTPERRSRITIQASQVPLDLEGRGDKWKELAYASPLCGACKDVCPVRLDIPKMLLGLRNQAVHHDKNAGDMKITSKAFGYFMTHPKAYTFIRKFLSIVPKLTSDNKWIKKSRFGFLKKWTMNRDLKAPASKTFSQMWTEKGKK